MQSSWSWLDRTQKSIIMIIVWYLPSMALVMRLSTSMSTRSLIMCLSRSCCSVLFSSVWCRCACNSRTSDSFCDKARPWYTKKLKNTFVLQYTQLLYCMSILVYTGPPSWFTNLQENSFNSCFMSSFDRICCALFWKETCKTEQKIAEKGQTIVIVAYLSIQKTWFCHSTLTLLREMSMRCVSRYFASSKVHVLTRLFTSTPSPSSYN